MLNYITAPISDKKSELQSQTTVVSILFGFPMVQASHPVLHIGAVR